MLVDRPVHATKGFPASLEIECVREVGIGLSEVAETQPEPQVGGYLVARVYFGQNLGNFLHDVAVSVEVGHSFEGRLNEIVVISRFLVGEKGMEVKTLEGVNLGRGRPAQGVNVINEKGCLRLRRARLRHVLLVNVIRLGDIRNHRGHIEPVVFIEHSAAQEGDGDALVLFFCRASTCIVADFRETRGYSGICCQSEAGGQVVGGLYGGGIVELVLHHAMRLNGYGLLVPFSVGISVRVANVEAGITCIGYLVGTHAVVLQSAAVEQAEFGGHLPVVSKVKRKLVFVTLGVFRAQFVKPVIGGVAGGLRAGQDFGRLCSRGSPLKRR